MLVNLLLFSSIIVGVQAGGLGDFFPQSGAKGTQHGKQIDDSKYYTSNSGVPHLPFLTGFMGTHGTYRFMTVSEQTAVVIGEAKHGLWRIQENGLIREYRKKGKLGVRDGVDPNSDTLDQNTQDIIKHNYASYIPEESWSGYKYPEERISNGKYDGMKDYLNFIDLSIYHPKYGGKYNDHVPIDLPNFYCTMTQNDYPHLENTWKFAMAQPMANRIGPLGKRAGIDIKETHFNAIRMEFFQDAGIWANVGVGNEATDMKIKNLQDLLTKTQTVNYQRIDFSKTNYEVYLVERPFFNKPYIFITVVLDNKVGPSEFSYVRQHGAYWKGLKNYGNVTGITNQPENHFPKVNVENYPNSGQSRYQKIYGLPVYGMHHPNRHAHGLTGGLCPERGGDWGRYPWSNSGSGFPNNYEEITPLCDAMVVDVKVWVNLWTKTWNDKTLLLGNAGAPGKIVIDFVGDANIYGKYTDPYLLNSTNPYLMDLTTNGKVVEPSDRKPNPIKLKLSFTRFGTDLKFNNASVKKNVVLPECPPPTKCEPLEGKESNSIPDWGYAAIVLLSVILIINIVTLLLFVYSQTKNRQRNHSNSTNGKHVKGYANDAAV